MTPIRTLLVDDNGEFLESVNRFLSQFTQIMVVGHAKSAYDAIKQLQQLKPDLVLMDVVMPEINGLEATHLMKSELKSVRVVILTLHNNYEYRLAAEEAGADGFISKSEISLQLLPLIKSLFKQPVEKI